MSTYNEAESFYEAADPNDDFDDLDPDPNLEGVNEVDPEVPPDQDPPEDIEPEDSVTTNHGTTDGAADNSVIEQIEDNVSDDDFEVVSNKSTTIEFDDNPPTQRLGRRSQSLQVPPEYPSTGRRRLRMLNSVSYLLLGEYE